MIAASATMVLLISVAVWARLLARMQDADFWEPQIRAFEEADKLQLPRCGYVLFTGSSTIRHWRTLDRDMAPIPVLNRGFGGCHLAHVNHYADRILIPYRPQAIVLYAGENDLGWPSKKTPEMVLEDFQAFVDKIQVALPEVRVYFISIKLSPFRRGRWDSMRKANQLIEAFVRERKGTSCIDVAKAMLDQSGKPRADLMPWYRFHMTGKGYELWTSIIKPVLERDLNSIHLQSVQG
jgi:hypothetical protein